ncbi:MAG: hypothetical protein GFH27_549305n60 [Chloroflexi bacterium AL-W]|nr:hypothetical protein [Chloroflexi bacterium AL-N1]NOK69306.1 hypothetical protein [Chloroflexi bacterium AL-N10]NOK76367.1 hypothetical protein [Chloroflexi bacterium AL-N5]NOK83484.1 hypothetical protein [Chloroflexi bacterium AL-W]NOK91144.1 hypothetical protein [Chloroflexi bacterium AL-N15]
MLLTFGLLFAAMCLTVTGEVLLKYGLNQLGEFSFTPPIIWRTFTNVPVFMGFVLIFGGALFWLYVISRFDLSFAYPLLGLNYVLILIPSWLILGEQVTLRNILGAFIIVLGVFVVTWRTQ